MTCLPRASALALALLLAACGQAPHDVASMTASDDPFAGSSTLAAAKPAPIPTATTTGIVEEIDPDAGVLTLAHDPVPALDWPAMTMAFHAAPALIARARPGERVRFAFHAEGARYRVTRIEPAR